VVTVLFREKLGRGIRPRSRGGNAPAWKRRSWRDEARTYDVTRDDCPRCRGVVARPSDDQVMKRSTAG
jgi:hypothetical protein